jgi:hypothetical protein
MGNKANLHRAVGELALLGRELDIHRDRFGRKEANKNTRALVLVGGSTFLAGSGSISARPLGLAMAAAAIVAAVLGALALRPSKGDEVRFDLLEPAIRGANSYRASLTLYRSKLMAHQSDLQYLRHRSRMVTVGFWFLVGGLTLAATSIIDTLALKGGTP